jgi:hypothetical protein
MAINLAALKNVKKGLDEKTGSKGFLNTKDLTPDGIPFRLLPPPAILNEVFHFNVQEWWFAVNGKPTRIIDVSTFGKDSVIQEEIDAAYALEDADVNEVLESLNPNTHKKVLIPQESAWMAGLQLEYITDDAGDITAMKVVDDCAKIFQCGKQTLLSDMISVASSRPAISLAKGCADGIADRVKGSNMLLSKEGVKLNTKYKAVWAEQAEMDAKYYRNIPNVYDTAKAQCANASWQKAAIRNFLYGEAIPADVQAKEDARAEKAKALYQANAANHTTSEDAPKPKAKKPVADEEEDEVVPVKKTKKPAPVEEEEDDEPVPVKKAAPKKQLVLEDEDDDAPAPVVKKKSPPPPPAAAPKKSAPAKSRSVLDDLDDDDMPF